MRELKNGNIHYLRSYPSTGGLYPLEVYPIILKSNEIEKGLYHYNVKHNTLEMIRVQDLLQNLSSATLYPEIIMNSSIVIIITGMFKRTVQKYNERGYRYILQESGHLAQNVYLVATALKLGCVSMVGFNDDDINNLLEIDGVNESSLYILSLGKIKDK